MQNKNTKLLNVLLVFLLGLQGASLINKSSAPALLMNPDFEEAIRLLDKHGPKTAAPTYEVLTAREMSSSFSPAQAKLNFGDKSCAIAVKENIVDDTFMKAISASTGWSPRVTALFVIAHETYHCEHFAKLDQILHGTRVSFADEVLKGLLPREPGFQNIMRTSDPWGNYIKASNDSGAQRLSEAASDLGALITVHKEYGLTVKQVRNLAKLRTDESQPGYDWQHDTAPWLRAFAAYIDGNNKIKNSTGNDILKTMTEEQTSRFIYQFLSEHQPG